MQRASRSWIPVAIALALVMADLQTAAAQDPPDWSLVEVGSFPSALVSELSPKTGQQRWRTVPEEETIVQVIASFRSVQGTIGPVRLSDLVLKVQPAGAGAAGAEFAPLTVGTWNRGCTYIDGRDIPEKNQAVLKLGAGGQLTLVNVGRSELQLTALARRMDICLAFSVPKTITGPMVLRAGRFELAVAQGFSAAPAGSTEKAQRETRPAPLAHVTGDIGAGTAGGKWLVGGAAALMLLMAFLGRSRLSAAFRKAWAFDGDQPGGDTSAAIPTLADIATPIGFSQPEAHAGPGADMLAAATRAIQGEDYDAAHGYVLQSLALGLSPGHLGRARLYLAEIALQRRDLLGAIQQYCLGLQCERLVMRFALPAATNLALIYRKLGMKQNALEVDRIVSAAHVAVEAFDPSRIQLIGELASALQASRRARQMPAAVQSARVFILTLFQRGV